MAQERKNKENTKRTISLETVRANVLEGSPKRRSETTGEGV